jgi:hypothetical protein
MTELLGIRSSLLPLTDHMGNFSLRPTKFGLYDRPQAKQKVRNMD